MLALLSANPLAFLIIIAGLLAALSFHEAAHAFMAYRLGDDTPKHEGRLTLNPLAHIDVLGFLALLIFRFGWGKAVNINPNNFRHPMRDNFVVALSGPAANLLVASVFGSLARLVGETSIFFSIFEALTFINVLLAIFNLIPIPPLDGSKILGFFMSRESYYELERYGPFILLAFLVFASTTSLPLLQTFSNTIERITLLLIGA